MNDVERVFNRLVNVLSERGPDRIRAPIEISEIYQSILPYRHHRSALEFDTNQDYEMALLRFLSGEGGFASVDPAEAQEALREEARGANPNPGAFREYAAAKVYLNTRAVRAVSDTHDAYAPPEPDPPAEPPSEAEEARLETQAMSPPFVPDTEPRQFSVEPPPLPHDDFSVGAVTFEQATTPEDGESPSISPPPGPLAPTPFQDLTPPKPEPVFTPSVLESRCKYCGGDLPASREVRFCPHCGISTETVLCAGCGSELDANWKFCVTCGKRSAPGDE